MLEIELFLPIKSLLESLGYKVYAEVLFKQSNRYIDIIALNDATGKSIAVELKLQYNKKLLEQGLFNSNQFSLSYIAIPKSKKKPPFHPLVGILEVDVENQTVTELHSPNPPSFLPTYNQLKDRLFINSINEKVLAGESTNKALTGLGVSVSKIINYITQNGETPLDTLLKEVQTHWKAPRTSLLAALRQDFRFKIEERGEEFWVGLNKENT